MTFNLPLLLLAIAALWIPRRQLRLGSWFKRRRSAEANRKATEPWNSREAGDPRVNFVTEFSKFRNYFDLVRAAAGSVALAGGMGVDPCLSVAPGASRNLAYAVMAVRALILLVGLLAQTVRFEKGRCTFYPAIFFIAGLSAGLCDPRSAAFAFALIWATHAAFGNAQAFLTVYAVLIGIFGHFFSRLGDLSVIWAAFLCFLPVLLSLLSNRPLVIFSRKGATK